MAENNQQPGGSPPGGSSSSSVSYSAATSVTSAGTYSNQTYSSSTADQNSVLVSLASGTVNLVNSTVTKTGDSDGGDNCNFYGINSAVMAMGGGTVSIVGGTVTASAKGANGVFSYGGNGGQNGAAGDGTTVVISDVTINTTGDNGGGIMTTGGGITKASNLTITTTGQSSAPIRTDRGGGSVTVSGGSYTSSGLGSPAIYSTADITVENASLTSNLSEGVCIEGQNSVVLTDCTLTANNTKTNGNAQFLDAVILYQSQSGDAASGTSTFSMTGGKLINKSGHLFHVTNTTAIINLNNVTIEDSGSGILLSVCDDGWNGASNIATLNASGQTLDGDILVGDDSTLTLNLTDGAILTGNISGAITNASGSKISSEVGTVNVSLDADSKWYLDSDVYVSSFSGTAANVITGSYTLYVNNVALDGTTENDTTALNIANTVNNTLITGSAYGDTITNSGENVTITALAGDDSIDNSGATTSIDAGTGNDTIKNTAANVTIQASAGDNFVMNNSSAAASVLVETGDGADLISNAGAYATITTGAGNDSVFNNGFGNAGTDLINLGDGNDTLNNFWASNITVNAGDGDNFIVSANSSNSSITAGSGNDTISNNTGSNVIISAGDGNDSINNVSGATVTIDAGAGDDYIYNTGASVTFIYTGGNDSVIGFNATSTLSIGGAYSSVASGDDLILTVGNDSITLSDAATLETVNIIGTLSGDSTIATYDDTSAAKVTLASGIEIGDASARTAAIRIVGNALDNSILGGSGKDTLYGKDGNDTLKGNAGNDKLYGQDGNDSLSGGDGADTLSGGSGNDKLLGGNGNDSLSGGDGADTLSGGSGNDKLLGGSGNDSLSGGDGADTLSGGNGNDKLLGGSGNDSLSGGDGTDTLSGGTGNDTLTGGNGDDLLIYSAGNDVITDYAAGDKISVSADVTASSVKGSDATFTIGSNTLTVTNGKGKEIVFVDADGNERTIIGGAYLSTDSMKSSVTLSAAWREVGDASERTTAIKLTGNANNNTLLGGSGKDTLYGKDGNDYLVGNAGADKLYGQNGDDTLWGGIGNDTLTGGAGADTFIYNSGEGKDVIADFGDDDLLQITGTFSATYNESKNTIAFKVGSTASAITLKNFTATTFNINGNAYQISGSELAKS